MELDPVTTSPTTPALRKRHSLARICVYFSLIIWLFLLVVPRLGWIVRSQLRQQFQNATIPFQHQPARGSREMAAIFKAKIDSKQTYIKEHYSNDLGIQIANIMAIVANTAVGDDAQSRKALTMLKALEPKFSDRPEFYSIICRIEAANWVPFRRTAVDISDHNTDKLPPNTAAVKSARVITANETLAYCTKWEKLQPENCAIFLYRAYALFCLDRDHEALETLHRAALSTGVNEYCEIEFSGRMRYLEILFHRQSALVKTSTIYGMLFPQYARWRYMIRTCSYTAGQLERNGDFRAGMRIRQDIRLIGENLLYNGTTAVANLVGGAFTILSASHPAGIVVAKNPKLTPDQRAEATYNRYFAFLHKHGADDEIAAMKRTRAAVLEIKNIVKTFQEQSPWGPADGDNLQFFWTIGYMTIANLVWLVIGGIYLWLVRQKIKSKPGGNSKATTLLYFGGLGLTLLFVVASLYPSQVLLPSQTLQDSFSLFGVDSDPDAYQDLSRLSLFILFLECSLGPITAVIVSFVVATCKFRRFSTVLNKSLGNGLAVMSVIVVLFYSLMVSIAAHFESIAEPNLAAGLEHEGKFAAQQLGKEWPSRNP